MTHPSMSKEPLAAALRSALGVGSVALLAAGCRTAKVDETRQVAASIQANESIVVLKKPQLEGIGTDVLTIHGATSLTPAPYAIMPDRMEAGTYLAVGGHHQRPGDHRERAGGGDERGPGKIP